MKPAVVLPTYNEAENIREMVRAVLAADPSITALVVDDNSPDGTGRIVDEMAATDPRVRALHRTEKRGRGYAGAAGFCWCLEQGFDPIIEMDADFSHDPACLPQLLKEAETWDIVIGSRSVEGGGAVGRGLARRFITWGAAVYLRAMLGVRVQDPTSGYRCFRRRVMEAVHPETLTSPGPGIVTEVLYRCRKFRIKEVPILFKDREQGRSKFGLKAMVESLKLAARLRFSGR